MSHNSSDRICGHVEWTKLRRKVLYHFTIFATVNKILVSKNYQIRASVRPITPSVRLLLGTWAMGSGAWQVAIWWLTAVCSVRSISQSDLHFLRVKLAIDDIRSF